MESGTTEDDWEIVDYYPSLQDAEYESEKKSDSRLGWVISTGFNVGKKVVITGVVVSSLPLLLPPLVVISSLGLALSVPYGVVLASYACTQKLMSKLLPPPPPPPPPPTQDELEEELITDKEEMGIELMDNEIDGIGRDDLDIDDDVVVVKNVEVAGGVNEEDAEEQKEQYSLDEKPTKDGENEKITVETKTVEEKKESGEENEKQGENLLQEKKNEGVIEENGTKEKETEKKIMTEEGDKSVQVEEDKKQQRDSSKESGKRRKKKKNAAKTREAEKELLLPENVGTQDKSKDDGGVVEEKIEVHSVIIEDDLGPGVTYYESTVIADGDSKGAELKEEKDIAGGVDAASHSQDQESFSDEKIWEKIDAIRDIAGFKAPRNDSYYEELKALYLFTGIEAPATSSDMPADFVEFYSKLSFLMSVIGVK